MHGHPSAAHSRVEIIDIDNQCAIWSHDNHGCTGSSAFFSQLDGDDCSSKKMAGMQIIKKYTNEAVALDKVANSTHPGYSMGGAEVCGTANSSSAAWVKVEKPG